jgi:hypothetical protein
MDYRKVYGGTPKGSESLCLTCTYAGIIRGFAESEMITICDRFFNPIRVPFPVSECSEYADRRLPDVEEMKEIAWSLRSKSAGHKAGFIPAKCLTAPQEDPEDDS